MSFEHRLPDGTRISNLQQQAHSQDQMNMKVLSPWRKHIQCYCEYTEDYWCGEIIIRSVLYVWIGCPMALKQYIQV